MMCQDDMRGKIRNRKRYKQPVDFSGLRYGRITPTDIDGYLEYHGEIFIFYELKLEGAPFEEGQRKAYCRLVDSLLLAGKYAVLFKCEHDVYDTEKDIDASKSIVTAVYLGRNAGWREGRKETAAQATERFLEYIKSRYGVT